MGSLPQQKTGAIGRPSATDRDLLQVQFHQVLEIRGQILFGELGEELGFGGGVDLADAFNQFLNHH